MQDIIEPKSIFHVFRQLYLKRRVVEHFIGFYSFFKGLNGPREMREREREKREKERERVRERVREGEREREREGGKREREREKKRERER
jgi:hypothetical protein